MVWSKAVAIVGGGAAVSWIGAATMVVAGALLQSGAHAANFIIPPLFLLVGAAQARHVSLVAAANKIAPAHNAMKSLMRSEALISLASLAIGLVLLAMSAYRVFLEAMPVFG